MAAPEVESLPWEEQLAVDDESYRAQLAYLFQRSAFYREKLATAGFGSPQAAGGLDNWVTASARSYAASGTAAGQRIVSTYNAGPFVAGAALAAFERIGLCHIPVGTGNTERLLAAVELLRPEAVVLRPSARGSRRAGAPGSRR